MSSPRSRILKLDAPEEYHADGLRYADAGFTREDAAELRRLIDSAKLILPKDAPETIDFLLDHAVQLIAELEGIDALDFLLQELDIALSSEDERFIEAFPHLVFAMGEPAVDPLIEVLHDPERSEQARAEIAITLGGFLEDHTAEDRILAAFTACLAGEPDLRALKGFIVAEALDHNAIDLLPLIRKAYVDNLVDVSICGDLDEVEVSFGIRPRRNKPRPDFGKLEADLLAQSRLDRFGPIPLDAPDEAVLCHAFQLFSSSRGVRDLAQLDGFLTGVIAAPHLIPPSHWLPQVWDDREVAEQPIWPSMEDAERVMQAMMARYNQVLDGVANRSLAPPADGELDSWLRGLIEGSTLWPDESYDQDSAHDLLIGRLLREIAEVGKTKTPEESTRLFRQLLALAGNAYDARSDEPPPESPGWHNDPVVLPFHRETPKVGRNDPCPCGSGKKFKSCCMT